MSKAPKKAVKKQPMWLRFWLFLKQSANTPNLLVYFLILVILVLGILLHLDIAYWVAIFVIGLVLWIITQVA